MYEEYTELTSEEAERYMQDKTNQRVRNYIPDQIATGKAVLEVGCGNGIDAPKYCQQFYTGIDISPSLIGAALEKYPLTDFMIGDATSLHFEDKKFDVVFCKSLLEHMPSEELAVKALSEMLRVAKEAVFVAWHTPPREIPKSEITKLQGHFGKLIFQNTYSKEAFGKLIDGRKFTTTQVDNFEVWKIC